jgi:HAD superfamily hydrolase (TIGR01509 family)
MLHALKQIHNMNMYSLVLCSNTNALHYDNVSKYFPDVINYFEKDRRILSFKQQTDKSSDRIFNIALQAAGNDISPQECLFIDDNLEYINRAERFGMKGIVYFKYSQLIIRMRELGIYLE